MTLRHLEIFSAVCAQESFTRAAEQLNMAQPAVSLAIRELEVFYNVRLFERMNRRVYLTEAGRTLRQYADTVLSQFQESVEVLRESGAQGACRFGVHVTLGETRLAGILAHLAEALPEITVRASIHNSRETERMILQNELDFAVVDNVTVSPHYLVEPLCGEELAAVCAPGYLEGKNSLTLAELAEERLLLRERGSGTRNSVDAGLQGAGATAQPVVESVSTAALLACARAGPWDHAAAPVSGGDGPGAGGPSGAGCGGRRVSQELFPGAPPQQVSDGRHEAGDPSAAGTPGRRAAVRWKDPAERHGASAESGRFHAAFVVGAGRI